MLTTHRRARSAVAGVAALAVVTAGVGLVGGSAAASDQAEPAEPGLLEVVGGLVSADGIVVGPLELGGTEAEQPPPVVEGLAEPPADTHGGVSLCSGNLRHKVRMVISRGGLPVKRLHAAGCEDVRLPYGSYRLTAHAPRGFRFVAKSFETVCDTGPDQGIGAAAIKRIRPPKRTVRDRIHVERDCSGTYSYGIRRAR